MLFRSDPVGMDASLRRVVVQGADVRPGVGHRAETLGRRIRRRDIGIEMHAPDRAIAVLKQRRQEERGRVRAIVAGDQPDADRIGWRSTAAMRRGSRRKASAEGAVCLGDARARRRIGIAQDRQGGRCELEIARTDRHRARIDPRGTVAVAGRQETGRQIERFTPFERSAHWANAIAFVILAVSGIFMAFGKYFILPVVGSTLFGFITYLLKNAHNFAGPLFAVSLPIVFFTFVKDNLPRREDWTWIMRFGGMLGGHEVPSHRFNAGEKVLFWMGVFLLGGIVIASGLVLDKLIPGLIYERSTMQVAQMIHAVATVIMMAMFMGHIYMGTIGMQGAYKAMRTGYVDETWAKEHHELWADDIAQGKIPAHRSPMPQPTTRSV